MVESIRVAQGVVGIVAGVGVDYWDRLQELRADYWEGKTSHSKGMEHMEHRVDMEEEVWVGWSVDFWVEATHRRYAYVFCNPVNFIVGTNDRW